MADKLVRNVAVNGVWYGPSYPTRQVPAHVAEKITNPRAWEGGEPPAVPTESPPKAMGDTSYGEAKGPRRGPKGG